MNFFKVSIAQAGVISDATPISTVLQNILVFLLSIIGVLAIIGVVIAGLIYLTASGNPKQAQRAKQALTASMIGLIIAFGSVIIVTQISKIFAE